MPTESHENVLPKSVQDKIDQANAIYRAVYEKEQPAKEPAISPDESLTAAEPTPAKPKASDEKTVNPEPAKEPAKEPDTFEHKFSVIKGKYDKEVPRLHRQVRDLTTTNATMKDRINALESQVAGLKAAAEKPPEPATPALTPEEVEQFGPDLVDIIERKAKEVASKMVADRLGPIEKTVKQVNESVASTHKDMALSAREQLLEDLSDAVPEWRKQNEDENFLTWLESTDEYSGKRREELLAEALQTNNAKRVISLFKGFQKENAVVAPTDQPSNETPVITKKPEQPLDELVAPGTPKTGSTGAHKESGKRTWTQRDITEFYAERNEFVKANPERDLPDHIVKLERDLFAAQTEGRVRI